MCLTKVQKPPCTTGIGYKIVRITDNPDVFLTYWPYMGTRGGLTPDHAKSHEYDLDNPVKITTRYRLGKWTRTTTKRTAESAHNAHPYVVGIHIFLRRPNPSEYSNRRHYSLVKVKYAGATLTDGEQIVARRVKILEVLS